MDKFFVIRMLYTLGQKGGLGSFITKRNADLIGLTNGWQIIQQDEENFMIRNYDSKDMIEFTVSKSRNLVPTEIKNYKTFIFDVFGYDLSTKKEDPFA